MSPAPLHQAVLYSILAALPPAAPPADAPGAAPATVRVRFSVTTSSASEVGAMFLAGDLPEVGAWRPDGLELARDPGGVWRAEVALPRGETLHYKLTRGDWDAGEINADGRHVAVRRLELTGDTEVGIEVEGWSAATAATEASRIEGDFELHRDFPSKHLGSSRAIAVYRPSGFGADPAVRYPVLYLHDAEQAFALGPLARRGSLRADVTVDRLIRQRRIPPILLVGIGSTRRQLYEYTPSRSDTQRAGGGGALYAQFVATELKPFIDEHYPTRPEHEYTAVVGSSFGGLVSLYIVSRYPERFGLCGALSPSLWWNDKHLLNSLKRDSAWLRRGRFWVDIGTLEGRTAEGRNSNGESLRELVSAFDAAELVPGRDYYALEVDGGRHDSDHWSARFDKVVLYLFAR